MDEGHVFIQRLFFFQKVSNQKMFLYPFLFSEYFENDTIILKQDNIIKRALWLLYLLAPYLICSALYMGAKPLFQAFQAISDTVTVLILISHDTMILRGQ